MLFDTRAAKALKAGDHLTVDGAPGLRLVASGAGRAWIYRYKSPLDGLMKQAKIGMWPALSASQAGVEWEKLRDQREQGLCPATARRESRKPTPANAEPTPRAIAAVGDLVDSYVEWAAPRRKPKGAAELRRTMSTMLDQRFRAMKPTDVSRTVAFDLISRYSGTPVQASSLRRELGAAWEWAHDAGRLDDTTPNWWRLILRGKLKSKGKIVKGEHQGVSKRMLALDEVGAILRHLPHVSKLVAEGVILYLWTGTRGAEIVQMEGRELSTDADGVLWWTLPKRKQKMERNVLAMDLPVPLLGRAREIVLARRDRYGDDHLFPPQRGKAKHIDQKVIGVGVWWHMPSCDLRPESERARWPVAGWSPHDLRRTVRTHLSRLGCDPKIAEAVLGHIDSTEGVYDRHDYRAERLEWLTRLTRCWDQASSR